MTQSPAFIPGEISGYALPLARYLPPVPAGVVREWLGERFLPGSWVLEPFGAEPMVAVEAARAGYRVIVAANNPVARFLLELHAIPPKPEDYQAALAALAAAYKGQERLEPHIRSIYHSLCANCGNPVEVEAYIWDRGANNPSARLYHCPTCGDSGERPIAEVDLENSTRFGSSLHRARALERVAPPGDPDRKLAEEAISVYPPRALYGLFTLINRLDAFPGSRQGDSPRRKALHALLLAAADSVNTLWPYPTTRNRPRQLTIPARYRENNLWLALERAADAWKANAQIEGRPIPVVTWPESPPSTGGISIYEGRLKELRQEGLSIKPAAVVAALPRPNQAFWSLSSLWSGWLWGKEAAAAFKPVLRRRRFDWSWHAVALHSALSNLVEVLSTNTPFFALTGEAEPRLLMAAVTAGAAAGFELEGIALRADERQAQISWRYQGNNNPNNSGKSVKELEKQLVALCQEAGKNYLQARAAPAHYLYPYSAALIQTAGRGILNRASRSPGDIATSLQTALQQAFSSQKVFYHYGGSERSPDSGQWWLQETNPIIPLLPLYDRIEIGLVRTLIAQPGSTIEELIRSMCQAFRGLDTPERSLLEACLQSYGEQKTSGVSSWRLRAEDSPTKRRSEIFEMEQALLSTGNAAGYRSRREPLEIPNGLGKTQGRWQVTWRDQDQRIVYTFYVQASALFGNLILQDPAEGQWILVLPGSRAGLVRYKLKNDFRLKRLVEKRLRLVKFRQVRRLLATERQLSPDSLDEQLTLDPFENQDPQMRLF